MEKLLLVIICLVNVCLIHSNPTIETWGELYNVRAADHRNAKANWFVFKIQNRTMTFPSVIMQNK